MPAQMLLGILFVVGKLASQIAVQQCVHPTSGTLRVFRHFVWLEVDSVKLALSPLRPLAGNANRWAALKDYNDEPKGLKLWPVQETQQK
jgi:hypothetical protein